jgi:predicted metal-dependent hydrolase
MATAQQGYLRTELERRYDRLEEALQSSAATLRFQNYSAKWTPH